MGIYLHTCVSIYPHVYTLYSSTPYEHISPHAYPSTHMRIILPICVFIYTHISIYPHVYPLTHMYIPLHTSVSMFPNVYSYNNMCIQLPMCVVYPSIHLYIHCIHITHMYIHIIHIGIHPLSYVSNYLHVYPSTHMCIHLLICISTYTQVYLSLHVCIIYPCLSIY